MLISNLLVFLLLLQEKEEKLGELSLYHNICSEQ